MAGLPISDKDVDVLATEHIIGIGVPLPLINLSNMINKISVALSIKLEAPLCKMFPLNCECVSVCEFGRCHGSSALMRKVTIITTTAAITELRCSI